MRTEDEIEFLLGGAKFKKLELEQYKDGGIPHLLDINITTYCIQILEWVLGNDDHEII